MRTNEELIAAMRGGCVESEREIYESNMRLIHHAAHKFDHTGVEHDDLFGYAQIGLVKAVRTFDPDKEAKFSSYAATCMHNEILQYLRKVRKFSREVVSLDDVIGADDAGNEVTLGDFRESPVNVESDVELAETLREIHEAMALLPARDRRIAEMSLFERRTQHEIAAEVGISQSYVARRLRAIKMRIRDYIEKGAMAS